MSTPHVDPTEPEGFTVNDKRRIDPTTGQVRAPQGAAPAGEGPLDPFVEESAEAATVEADVAAVEAAVAELTTDLQRVHAEYANYRKRVERDRELVSEMATAKALAALLPILDDIGRAREHGELEGAFRSVGESLEATITKLGLETYGAEGEEFDPTQHEALTHSADEAGDGPTVTMVTAVYQPGYRFGERIVRPARVAVADRPATA